MIFTGTTKPHDADPFSRAPVNEYRVTRPDMYRGNCTGNTDLTARQGYYVDATDLEQAHRKARALFPGDSRFDITMSKSPSPG